MLKICKVCKQEKSIDNYYYYNKSKNYRYSTCISCHKQRVKINSWKNSKKQPTHEERKARSIISGIRSRTSDTDLTVEWLLEKLKIGVCEVTNLPFKLNVHGSGRGPWTPSVDKINPEKGYFQDNCRVVVWAYNAAKGTWTDEEVKMLAKAVVKSL